jgi:hypothetical protein
MASAVAPFNVTIEFDTAGLPVTVHFEVFTDEPSKWSNKGNVVTPLLSDPTVSLP